MLPIPNDIAEAQELLSLLQVRLVDMMNDCSDEGEQEVQEICAKHLPNEVKRARNPRSLGTPSSTCAVVVEN
eukprot:s1115_g16.t1